MSADHNKIAHLGFIQGVINRMGNNSFLVKGWTVALIAGVFALSSQDNGNHVFFVFFAFVLTVLFWLLDAYFLYQENRFRELLSRLSGISAIFLRKDKSRFYLVA